MMREFDVGSAVPQNAADRRLEDGVSPRRLLWTGVTCLALATLSVVLGLIAQALLVASAIRTFHIVVTVPLTAAHGVVGQTDLSVPYILPMVLAVAWLFVAIALGCLLESGRRTLRNRKPPRPVDAGREG
jgi:hypothetical protein